MHNISKKKAYWTFYQTVLQRHQLNNDFQYIFWGGDLNLKKGLFLEDLPDWLFSLYLASGHMIVKP